MRRAARIVLTRPGRNTVERGLRVMAYTPWKNRDGIRNDGFPVFSRISLITRS
jgi:hypothetical protein